MKYKRTRERGVIRGPLLWLMVVGITPWNEGEVGMEKEEHNVIGVET